MKRFYKQADFARVDDGYQITLDGKPVRTPAGHILLIPLENLARISAQEWQAQTGNIDPQMMPATQMIIMGMDHVAPDRASIENHIKGYLDTDLLCYRTDQPEAVALRQSVAWDPWIEWFHEGTGFRMRVTTDLRAIVQEPAIHDHLRHRLEKMDTWQLTVMQVMTALTGSVILALAFMDGAIDDNGIVQACHVEEDHKAEIYREDIYGSDPQQEKTRAAMRRDVAAARRILDAVQNSA